MRVGALGSGGRHGQPAGYLTGSGRAAPGRHPRLPAPAQIGVPGQPGLIPALLALPETQRTAV